MISPKELRRNTRYVLRMKASFCPENMGKTLSGYTSNVSLNGLFLDLPNLQDIHAEGMPFIESPGHIELSWQYQDEEFHLSAPCFVKHVVVGGLGIAFTIASAEEMMSLAKVLESVLSFPVGSQVFSCTPENRLVNINEWDEEVALALAEREGVSFTDGHWEMIHLMRQDYENYSHFPGLPVLKKQIVSALGEEKASDDYLKSLFPKGIEMQGTRIAGVPVPQPDWQFVSAKKQRKADVVDHHPQEGHVVLECEGSLYEFDKMGHLLETNCWTESLAEVIAAREGLVLTEDHWEVLHVLRAYYDEFATVPSLKVLIKAIQDEYGSCQSDRRRLYRLFPKGPSKQGSRIAGVPEPVDCSAC